MSKKSTAAYSVFIISTVCLLFAAFLFLPRKQTDSSKTELGHAQTQKIKEEKRTNEQSISNASVEDLFEQNSVQRDSKETIQDEAQSVLENYQKRADCALVYSGYIDLAGNVWSCLVNGGNWSELVTISDQGEIRRVSTCHISTQDVKNLLEESN
ncbi:hypothetical protein [Lancefieldella parvula]|uniref:hypothetical protein n=1 Tax=Lancefieldella parvula TaxID=1382 RepID=UPI00288078B8|nr:hypothetical protein [Lancefieldella parvula]MDU4868372.1 hypothetical protein [Lancefieldella parvula]